MAANSPKISQLAQVITCHAWNKDRSMLAICPNNTEVRIFKRGADGQFNKDEPEFVLNEHDQVVTGIDWGAETNRLVTCSQDRNAYVWEFIQSTGTWKPTLVILRINRAATDVKWSPNEDKFAVASGAKSVSVCYFEEDNDWWVSKHIRKQIRSTILSIDWHPNNILLACGGTDRICRVVSGFVKGIDKKPGQTPFGARLPFGENLGEYPCTGWVHDVKWAPSGNQLAWVGHDASVNIVDVSQGAPGYQETVKSKGLPFTKLVWLDEASLVAVGHSCNPTIFEHNGTQWVQGKELDTAEAKTQSKTGTSRAFAMFQNKVTVGQDTKKSSIATKHQNSINFISWVDAKHVATSGLDGKVIIWGTPSA